MSTRSTIKYSRPDNAPGYHLFNDCFDVEEDGESAHVELELFGVEAEVSTAGYVHVVLPRTMVRELGLLPPKPADESGVNASPAFPPLGRAADFLGQYAGYIREVKPEDIERHPYLPELEEVTKEIRAAAAVMASADQRNHGLLQAAKQALAALDRYAATPNANLLYEARSCLRPAIAREEVFHTGAKR